MMMTWRRSWSRTLYIRYVYPYHSTGCCISNRVCDVSHHHVFRFELIIPSVALSAIREKLVNVRPSHTLFSFFRAPRQNTTRRLKKRK